MIGLITKKSECRRGGKDMRVTSPKEAIRRTLKNYLIKDGFIIRSFHRTPSLSNKMVQLHQAGYIADMPIGQVHNN